MSVLSLKRYLPRGLFGRAALILVLPVLTLQLVVSIVFIQRHFEGVTKQMTQNVALEMNYLLSEVEAAPEIGAAATAAARLAEPLRLEVLLPGRAAPEDMRRPWDLSGRVVTTVLRQRIDGVDAVDLVSDWRAVRLTLDTIHGPMGVIFPRNRVSASNPHQLLVLMVFTGILMTVIAYLFLRNQLRPISRLAAAADAFGKGRHDPYHPSGALEVRSAGNAFLAMRSRIERQIEQRTLMLSGVSHDLRTPLTRLRLGLSMLEPGPEVEEMERDLTEMERLLDEFLSFARGDALDDPVATDPEALARRVVDRARRGGADVAIDEIDGAGEAMLRPMAIERALDNLIGNAVRYGTKARVSLSISDRAVRISVEDDGPGIPSERRGEALKPFARLDVARNQDRGSGVGLGLSIAHDIARRHGGILRLGESPALGGLRADLVLAR